MVAGSGTLGIPYAIQQGGWITVLLLILSAIMSVYANIKLIECLYHDNKLRRISMSQVAYDAFGKIGLGITSFFFNSLKIYFFSKLHFFLQFVKIHFYNFNQPS